MKDLINTIATLLLFIVVITILIVVIIEMFKVGTFYGVLLLSFVILNFIVILTN